MRLAWLVLLLILAAPVARAEQAPAQAVRGYFAALEHKDWDRALALTSGPALDRTARMLGTLTTEARRHHADFELKVRALRVDERAPAEVGVPVDVRFEIDVIGKKWIFRRLARKLTGYAQFIVEGESPPRIVAILGKID